MKKFLLFFTLVVCVVFKAEASENVIKNPYHLFQNRFKGNCVVTRTDTTTVFTFTTQLVKEGVFYVSSDTRLRDKNGRVYPLRQILSDDGFQMDVSTPAGERQFTYSLVFPSLPDDIVEVDLTDPKCSNQGIFGMRIDGSKLPPLVLPDEVVGQLKETLKPQASLPGLEYRFGWATIKGHLLEYRPGMAQKMVLTIGSPNNSPHFYGDTLCARVSDTGDFTFRFPVAHLSTVSLELPLNRARNFLFVGPDTETEVYVNMRELCYRDRFGRRNDAQLAYITKGPMAQLANEVSQQTFWYNQDFNEKYFKMWVTVEEAEQSRQRWERLHAMKPSQRTKARLEELDTLKPDEQWSPALKEYAQLYWRVKEAEQSYPGVSSDTEKKLLEKPDGKKELAELKRDVVKAELLIAEKMLNNPQLLLCPDIFNMMSGLSTLVPDSIAYERTAWELIGQMALFYMLNPEDIADNLKNLPQAYRQWVLSRQKYYREEHDRLIARQPVCDTIQGVSDSLVVPMLCERYKGKTLFIHFWGGATNVMDGLLLPLQEELSNRDIVWINVFTGDSRKDKAMYNSYAIWLRYGAKMKGVHYYYPVRRYKDICQSMGIKETTPMPFCVVSPEGKILRNNTDTPWHFGIESFYPDYPGIRQCLLDATSYSE